MDSHERRSRQSNAPGFAASQAAGAPGAGSLLHHGQTVQATGQYPSVSGPGDRYQVRAGASQLPPGATTGRGGMPSYPYSANPSGYADLSSGSTMQAASLQYPQSAASEYGASQDTSRTPQQSQQHAASHPAQQQSHQHQSQHHQPQSQSQYHSMYGQSSPSSPYDSVQQYPPRQSAAIEVLTNQFAGVPPTYYVAGEGGPTSAPTSAIAPQGVQPQYNPISYTTQSSVGRDSLASAYATGMADPQTTGSQSAYGQPTAYSSQTAELDNAFGQYQDALRRTFESVRDGNLAAAGSTLVEISDWLLSNAEMLGLVRDDESTHGERLKLWSEFNNCWLAMLQKQKDLSLDMLDTGQRPHPPQTVIEFDQLESMGKELVRLCDIMEKHGLVDYQMGVWEEEIISLLTTCLDLLGEQGANQPSLAQPPSRRR